MAVISEFKRVKYVLPAELVDMGGFPVKQPLPTGRVDQVDPFLLLHHATAKIHNDRPGRVQGIGPHPHKGFSPVTFVVEGEVHHRDSRGHNQIAKAGEVQWMHSGAGIVHSERPSEALAAAGGKQEIVQLWINSPAESKTNEPVYVHLLSKNMPRFTSPDGKVNTKLIAGNYEGKQGKAPNQSPLLIMWSKAETNGKVEFEIPEDFDTSVYLIKGELKLTGYGPVDAEDLVIFKREGNSISFEAKEDSQFLLLAGKPIGEEVVQHGPFVMNTQTEIMEAMRDYQMGKMGILIEDELI